MTSIARTPTHPTMRILIPRPLTLALGALALLSAPAAGQGSGAAPWAGAAGARLESYAFADPAETGIDRVSLFTAPFAAEATVGRRAKVTVSGAFAAGRLVRADGSRATLTGLTDTEVRVAVPVVGEWMTLTGAVALPTGKDRLTADELEVAAVVASDLLPFAISHWGGGQLGGVGLQAVRRVGTVGVTVSGGYRAPRASRAFEGSGGSYRPGGEAAFALALERAAGAGRATLEAGMSHSAADRLAGANLYRAGNRYFVTGSYAFAPPGRVSGVLYAGVLHREDGVALATISQALPAQDLALLGLGARVPAGRIALLPAIDGRLFRSADGGGQGYGVAAGGAVEIPAGALLLVSSARMRMGEVWISTGSRSRFTGAELGLTLRRGGR